MIKDIFLAVFTLLLATTISIAASNLVEEGYQTIKGSIYEEGTATISNLILKSGDRQYLITGLEDKLTHLKGLDLILTGDLKKLNKGPYDGELDVYKYNIDYDRSAKELSDVSILGDLVATKDNLVLLTPDQIVIDLDSDTYHALDNHLGKEVVINGSLKKDSKYKARMKLKSYRIVE